MHEGVGPRLAGHLDRIARADAELDFSAWAAVEEIHDHVGRIDLIAGDRRAEQLAHAELAIKLAVGAMVVAVEHDAHLARARFVRRLEPRRIAVAVDAEHVEAVRAAVAAVGDRDPAMIDRAAPP